MGEKLRARLRRKDGAPASYPGVLTYAVERITAASKAGVALRLSAEEVRALDWAVIRQEGGLDSDGWREAHCTAGNAND